ncbi:MAG: toll/interleukin-1 receptor domain-containing protein [Lachnospiraceae bacterium]|nr:toll/interleukin-1 receptor domain-containing protein [Lachnospiraceae bacterium]
MFISYASGDKRIADLLCQKLEEKKIKTWYAPRDIKYGNYAKNIVDAIANSTHFITVISQNSMESEHVLNEIDLAFEHLKSGLVIIPFRIDTKDLRAEFNYYLKRQQWVDAQTPPLERRIDEMISRVFGC